MTRNLFPIPKGIQSTGASGVQRLAKQAMQAIIKQQPAEPGTQAKRDEIAMWAYRTAQAMMVAEQRLGINNEPAR